MEKQTNNRWYIPGMPKLTATKEVMEAVGKVGKLPREFKDKWLEALRSGDYIQCREMLTNIVHYDPKEPDQVKDGYCCLGVGCLVAGYPRERLEGSEMPADMFDTLEQQQADTLLPPLFKGEACATTHPSTLVLGFLATTNDSEDYSFEEIADWIEENL